MNITRTYSVGDKGRVRRLTNLSGAWIDVSPATNLVIPSQPETFYDVETDPTDANKVYAIGETNAPGANIETFYGIAVSDDAGATWNQPYDLVGGDYSSLYFTPTPPTPYYSFHEVSVVDSNTIYVCGDTGWVVKSVDGGQSFNKCTQLPAVTLYGPADGPSPPLAIRNVLALHFITPLIGVVACGGNIFKTINGGSTWIHLNGGLPIAAGLYTYGGVGVGIHMSQDSQTIVCLNQTNGTPANIVRSTDGGTTWTQVFQWLSSTGTGELTGLHLTWTDDLHLWGFSKYFGRIVSTDGGATWTYLELPHVGTPSKNDYAGHFFNNTNGFHSEGDNVYYTTNGGVTKVLSETAPYDVQALWTNQVTTCYLVTDCTGVQEPFVTNSDLSNYVGMTLQSCIDVPPLVRQYSNPPDTTSTLLCYRLTDCCDPTHVTLVHQPPATLVPPVGLLNGYTITFPLVYPGVCWTITEDVCLNNVIPYDPLLGAWWSGVYNVYNTCFNCVNAISSPCAIVSDFYTLTNCCDNTIQLYIGIEQSTGGIFPYAGMVVQIPSVPELGNNCWFVEKGTQGPPTIGINPLIDTVISYPDCASSPCTCVTNWPNDCYCVTISETTDCTGAAPWVGTIGEIFNDCQSCVGVCYILTDCEGILDPIQTSHDLSAFVGQIIQLDNCDTCWIVSISPSVQTCCWELPDIKPTSRDIIINDNIYNIPTPGNPLTYLNGLNLGVFTATAINPELTKLCVVGNETYGNFTLSNNVQTVEVIPTCLITYPECTDSTCTGFVTANFTTCEECLPSVLPTPFELHVRKVKPGYDTPGCSPEYTEKVLCTFAEGVFDQMAVKRYGITVCCDIDVDKWDIKRQLLELSAIYDPSLCVCLVPPPPPVITCYCWEITTIDEGCIYDYIDCNGVNQTITLYPGINYVCSTITPTLNLLSPICKSGVSIVNLGICTDVSICNNIPCYCWDIELAPSQTCDYDYVDCDGNILTINCIEGHNTVCSRIQPYIPAGSLVCLAPIAITNLGDCAICPVPVPVCHCYSVYVYFNNGDDITYTDCNGNTITVSLPANSTLDPYYLCAQNMPIKVIGSTVITEVGDCGSIIHNGCSIISTCHYWVVTSTASTTYGFTYTDCLDNPVGSTIDPGQSLTICAQGDLNSPSIFVTFIDTGINCIV